MNYYYSLAFVISSIYLTNAQEKCEVICPTVGEAMVCGFDVENVIYKMFPSKCALSAYAECYKIVYVNTPLEFCIKHHNQKVLSRKMYGDSCPVFCPTHYRPVCGASKLRSYNYRSFNNGCYLDMLNCRGQDEEDGYVEVPLSFCQRHSMKNIFKEQVVVTGLRDYRDYE